MLTSHEAAQREMKGYGHFPTQPCEDRIRSHEMKPACCVYQHETMELVENVALWFAHWQDLFCALV